MMVSKGEIWLVNLNPIKKNNEMGKIRLVVIYQNNELNYSDYPTTIILPLSTSLIDDENRGSGIGNNLIFNKYFKIYH